MKLVYALALGIPVMAQSVNPDQLRADQFLKLVNAGYQALTYVNQEAVWKSVTDVKPEHDAAAEAAGRAYAAFNGSPALISEARELLKHRQKLDPVTVLELEHVLFNAAEGPMTNPAVTQARIAAETAQNSTQNGFVWKLEGKAISANEIDRRLQESNDLEERLKVWMASKENGPALREGLLRLRDLRNGCARELGYSDYFALQAARHGMSSAEMLKLHRDFLEVLKPLYVELHTWAKFQLAKKYRQPVPSGAIPAHWINNRWSQEWTGMVDGVNFDPYFKTWKPEDITHTAEKFFVGLGFPSLPASFWAKSDLYPIKPGENRKKNSHASCWHLDLDQDVRSLMSVEPNFQWFSTAHHEFGHAYYQFAYSNPSVPLLRDGATTAFHEGVAELISLATRQVPYLKTVGVLPQDFKADDKQIMLAEALETALPFMFWASGTMTEWEAEFYGGNLPADRLNQRWWELVKEKQGVVPPSARSEAFCDPATKTHINDAPAYYFNYAIAFVMKYQFHDYVCRNILKQDVHGANYANHPEVGAWMKTWLSKGASEDWRTLLKTATGEELSTRAMKAYFQPLTQWLQAENARHMKEHPELKKGW